MNESRSAAREGANGALQGVHVLDLSEGIAGPFAARLLGDFGAVVTKIEKPETGDAGRRLEPTVASAPAFENSLMFQYLNWNKRSLCLNLSDARSHLALERLVRQSQILFESQVPGQMQDWGLGVDRLLEWNPSLVVVSITPFGQTGPYAHHQASDLVLQAMSGIMQISGRVDREPLKHGLNQSYFCAGLNAAYAALTAYIAACRDGQGEHVDVSIMECLASELVYNQPFFAFLGAVQGRRSVIQDPFDGEPIEGRDGYVAVQAGGGAPFEDFADFLGIPELADPELATPTQRIARAEELRGKLAHVLAERDPKELFVSGANRRLLIGVVQSARDLLSCEHLDARGFFRKVEHPATGSYRFPGELVKMSETPTTVRSRAPLLDEHGWDILHSELGLSPREISAARGERQREATHA